VRVAGVAGMVRVAGAAGVVMVNFNLFFLVVWCRVKDVDL